jgi:hypothetical protein
MLPILSKVKGSPPPDDVAPLSPAQIREITRRLLDLKDRTRFLTVSAFTARTAFYYDVSQDTWGMNDPSLGTLFKRRATAIAVQRLLRDGARVVRCQVDRRDRILKKSIPRVRAVWLQQKHGARA